MILTAVFRSIAPIDKMLMKTIAKIQAQPVQITIMDLENLKQPDESYVIDGILFDGALFLTASHARHKKKAGRLGAPPICKPNVRIHHVHLNSVFAGGMMFEASLRSVTKQGSPPHLQTNCVYDGFGTFEKVIIAAILLDGTMSLTASHARHDKQKAGGLGEGWGGAQPTLCANWMYVCITGFERVHMGSVHCFAGSIARLIGLWLGYGS